MLGVLPDGSVLHAATQGIHRTPAGEATEPFAGNRLEHLALARATAAPALGSAASRP